MSDTVGRFRGEIDEMARLREASRRLLRQIASLFFHEWLDFVTCQHTVERAPVDIQDSCAC